MTIRLLTSIQYGAFEIPSGAVIKLDAAVEGSHVALGAAEFTSASPVWASNSGLNPVFPSEVSGDGVVNSRDGMGRVTSLVVGGITYSITYGNFGVDTISGGGQIMTISRSPSGLVTSVTTV